MMFAIVKDTTTASEEYFMEKVLDLISGKMAAAFEAAGYDRTYGRVTVSNRPDLCEYQCNGALAAAKSYGKAPMQIAQAVVEQLQPQDFESVTAMAPVLSIFGSRAHFCSAIWQKCGPLRISA